MCTVEKIMIKGIRSFSPDNNYIIEFYKPLTIIVGSNGAGKTTIIECLRNATTGELPPNTRQGQGFVHDPKVAGETEVKGQIKLQFRTATGSPIIVTRSFMLTQKKTALQFKSLDAVMTCNNKDTGARETLTYRCADLDRIVPPLMGVSKAVLENVIFVHQEESNWPLAEGKVLKEKFDDIFAATKYTKALEALRKLRTDKTHELKEDKLKLDTERQIKDMAATHARQRDAAQAQVSEGRSQLQAYEARIQDLERQRAEVAAQQGEIESLALAATTKRGQLDMLRAQNAERDERLRREGRSDFDEPDEALQAHLADADRQAAERAGRLRGLEAAVNSLRISKDAMADAYQRDCLRHGQLAAEAAAHARNVAERDRVMRAAAVALALPLPDAGAGEGEGAGGGGGAAGAGAGAAPAAAAAAFVGAVETRVRELEGRVAALRAEARSTDARTSAAVDAANAALARAQEGVRLKRQQMADNSNAISRCGAQIQDSQFTTADAEALKQDAEDAQAAYERKQAEEAASDHGRQAAEHRAAVETAARRLNELRAERARAAAAAEGSAKLRVKRTDLRSREEKLDNVVAARRHDIARVLGLGPGEQLPPLPQLKAAADAAVARLRSAEAERMRAAQAAHQAAQAARSRAESAASELARCRADTARLQGELRSGVAAALGGDAAAAAAAEEDLNNRISSLNSRVTDRRNKLSSATAMSTLFVGYRNCVAAGEGCPVCKRPFVDHERQECLADINNILESLPTKIASHERAVATASQQLEALRALQPAWVRHDDLTRRLPALEAEEARARAEAEEAAEKAESAQVDYAEASEAARDGGRVAADAVWVIDRMAGEVESLRREIAALDASGGAAGGAAVPRSVSEVDVELERVEAARGAAEAARDAALARAARLRDEVLALQRGAVGAQQRAMDATAAVRRVAELQTKMRELEAANAALEAELRAAHGGLGPLEGERERAAAAREEVRRGAAVETAAAEEQLRAAQMQAMQVTAAAKRVSDYEARGRGAEVARAEAALAALQKRMEAEAAELATREEELRATREEASTHEAVRREVLDMLELRAAKRAEEGLAGEVAELDAAAAAVGDPAALSRSLRELSEAREAQRSQQDQLRGRIAAAQAAAARAQADLNDPKYRNIQARFAELQVKVKTTELAMSDLNKYYNALEKALLAFHTTKMADINKMIRELWQKTYRGQDIDYIQIKADTEGVGARSYNYRVVMYSGAAELEMRGRCSAGQKVLACLIIRLALAETFCLNCGILALDEPTTNLDAENSASLAEALRSLMVSRAAQENFQLIVITHDERFARLIGTREYVEHLWRVTKDDAQHTQVLPEEVGDE